MRIARSTGAVSGVLIALLGIWGALIPFVGPYFDYSFGINTSWHYSTDRLSLNIIPGFVAMLAGILLLTARTRPAGVFAGWAAVVAGAWFAIGPPVSVSWEHGLGPIGPPLGGSTRQMFELIGYFYGLGALIIALGAFATGRFTSRPALAADVPAPEVEKEPSVAADPRRSRGSVGDPSFKTRKLGVPQLRIGSSRRATTSPER